MNTKFEKLIKIFFKKNSEINLSWIKEKNAIKIKHIQDSLEINKVINLNKWQDIIDFWTWWGFPLLPLAISNPKSNFTWIDARRKKIDAINDIINQVWIENAKWVRTRAEEHKWKYDILTTRAVWYVDKIFSWSIHLVKKWGFFILLKEEKKGEYNDLETEMKKHKLKLTKTHKYKLFENDINRIIYLLKKI